jgi:hypothetical protein
MAAIPASAITSALARLSQRLSGAHQDQGVTTIPAWLPVIAAVRVSVALTERLPAVLRVMVNRCVPASVDVKA